MEFCKFAETTQDTTVTLSFALKNFLMDLNP